MTIFLLLVTTTNLLTVCDGHNEVLDIIWVYEKTEWLWESRRLFSVFLSRSICHFSGSVEFILKNRQLPNSWQRWRVGTPVWKKNNPTSKCQKLLKKGKKWKAWIKCDIFAPAKSLNVRRLKRLNTAWCYCCSAAIRSLNTTFLGRRGKADSRDGDGFWVWERSVFITPTKFKVAEVWGRHRGRAHKSLYCFQTAAQ